MTEFASGQRPKILVVCNVAIMVWDFLRPWLKALKDQGHDVEIACARGQHFDLLAAEGYRMWDVPVARRFNPFANLQAFLKLWRLMRSGGFTVINTHSPVASAVGRLAAWFAGSRNIVYTVHGFYFHGDTPRLARALLVAIEWMFGRVTDRFMFVSEEDRQTALRTGIARDERMTTTIYNGIDVTRFRQKENAPGERRTVGIVARIVKEKGYREFLEMAKGVAAVRDDVDFLVIGDCLPSDRDRFGEEFKRLVKEAGLEERFHFTGRIEDVPPYLRQMDIFVLPSYREGFPVSVLEAMATGLPVVTSAIRGCREAVVHGKTGLHVTPRDARELTESVMFLLDNPDIANRMGEAGRQRAVTLYEEQAVAKRFAVVLGEAARLGSNRAGITAPGRSFERAVGRMFEVMACILALVALAPVIAAVAVVVWLKLGRPIIFRHRRPGLRGAPFILYKFRTMSNARGPDGKLLPEEERMTGWGNVLRACSLDELPQLWNVLKGDMSLVGPRPLVMRYLPRYTEGQMRRHEIRPGITGWAQIHGRNSISWEEKFELDVWYVDHWSFWLDMKILALTFRKVIRRDGITEEGQSTSSEFLGSSNQERGDLVACTGSGGD